MRTGYPTLISPSLTGLVAEMRASVPFAAKTAAPVWTNTSHANTGIAPRPLDPQRGSTG